MSRTTSMSNITYVRGDTELIEEFIAQADVVDSTRHHYRVKLTEFVRWLNHPETTRGEPAKSLLEIRRADIARFMAYLLCGDRYAATLRRNPGVAASPSTRKGFLASLGSFYRYLVLLELIDLDPTFGVPRPKIKVKRGLCLTPDEVRLLLAAPGAPRCRIQAYLLAYTGARVHEIRNLRWCDVSFVHGTMLLRGKGGKDRLMFIHPRLMPELHRWSLYLDVRAERDAEYQKVRANPEKDFVLISRTSTQIPQGAIYKQLNRRAVKAGLYQLEPAHGEQRSLVSPHVLRRTFATILLNAGEHLDAVSDVLGHESVDTTRKHYAYAAEQRRRATIFAFNV